MEKTEIQEKVTKIIAEQLGVDKPEVPLEKDLMKDLNADSLDALEITMEIELEFDITIPDDAAGKLKTTQQIIDYLGCNLNPLPPSS